jgi:hypothetical protein
MCTDWLALSNCTVYSLAVCTQVPENLLLPSSNILLISIKSTFAGISSLSQRYHVENVLRAQHPTFFRKKKNPYEAYCSSISDMTTAGLPHVPCNVLPCYFLESLLTTTRKSFHALLSLPLRMRSNCSSVKSCRICGQMKTPLLDICSTDS